MDMSRRFIRAGAAVTLVAGLGLVATPASALKHTTAPADCIEYGDVHDAPKGYIPRDDRFVVHKDPLAKWRDSHARQIRAAQAAGETITVPVAFHVIQKNNSLAGGNIPDQWIKDQMQVLNDSFSGATGGADTDFAFELESVDRTTKASWFHLIPTSGDDRRYFRGSGKEIKMKQALHTGDAQTLNIYTANLGRFLLGWAYLPEDFSGDGALPRFFDGVVVDFRSLPGGPYEKYSEGDTGTHEVGHWLGLLHTFDNGCETPGDFVADTAYEASPAFNCPVGRDTCEQPGVDPITNFMDYTQDSCMFEFTSGQSVRMLESWLAFRS